MMGKLIMLGWFVAVSTAVLQQSDADMARFEYIVDNDFIFLDKFMNRAQFYTDRVCNCESEVDIVILGNSYYPKMLFSLKCLDRWGRCPGKCEPSYYWVTVLKRAKRSDGETERQLDPPPRGWVAHRVNVTAACIPTHTHLTFG